MFSALCATSAFNLVILISDNLIATNHLKFPSINAITIKTKHMFPILTQYFSV